MAATQCTDRVVGAILASWRYDISGIFPEMRKDYEQHFAECPHCRARQRFHRGLDATLAVLTSLAVFFSVIALVLVLTTTPAPSYLGGIAVERARLLEERLPEAIKALRPR